MHSNISTKAGMEFMGRLHLPQCQSTNDEIQSMLTLHESSVPEGFVLSTGYQTAGRGQRGSLWQSEPEKNLLFSLLLRPDFLEPRFAFRLTATVATGVANALAEICPDLKLKWPNDVYVNDRKLGGMLIETVISGNSIDRAICGIGLNVNQLSLPEQAISLAEISGRELDTEDLLRLIYREIMLQYLQLRQGNWEGIRRNYLKVLYRLAIPAWYRLPDGSRFRAVLKSITEEGELLLICQDGEKRFRFKEVQFET